MDGNKSKINRNYPRFIEIIDKAILDLQSQINLSDAEGIDFPKSLFEKTIKDLEEKKRKVLGIIGASEDKRVKLLNNINRHPNTKNSNRLVWHPIHKNSTSQAGSKASYKKTGKSRKSRKTKKSRKSRKSRKIQKGKGLNNSQKHYLNQLNRYK